jgi:hypothetical protein
VSAIALVALLPLLAEAELVVWMREHGVATVMLGAAVGSTRTAIAVTAAALVLRVYVVVVLPGLCVAWLVSRAWAAAGRRRVPVTEEP